MAPAKTLEQAAAFVDRVGIAVIFPNADLVLPSLWEAVAGARPLEWSLRDEEGKFVSFTPEFDTVWRWKDELPERKLACAGKHLGRWVALVSPTLVAAVYSLVGRTGSPDDFRAAELPPLQRELAEAVLEVGASSGPELRRLVGTADKRGVERAIEALQRELVLTGAGVVEQEHGWPAVRYDLFARRWRSRLRLLPTPEAARALLARRVLAAAGEASAADLGAALGWRVKQAAAVLQDLDGTGVAVSHDEEGIAVWSLRPHAADRSLRR